MACIVRAPGEIEFNVFFISTRFLTIKNLFDNNYSKRIWNNGILT